MERLLRSIPHRALAAGDALPLSSGSGPELRLEVLHPPPGTVKGNDGSLTLRLVHGDHGLALLTGDLERDGLRALLASGQNLQADVLVAPHHGSGRSLLPEFYTAVAPRLMLVSCGAENRYGYPAKSLVQVLREKNIRLLSTAESGQIQVSWEVGKTGAAALPYTITTHRQPGNAR